MLNLIARVFLKLTGWKTEGEKPSDRRCVLIAAPHTSNWDLAYLLALSKIFGVKISWMGKDTLFKPPLGWLMRAAGGIPVVRHKRGNLVAQAAQRFADSSDLTLVVPAEGTRGAVEYWKSGFYHIAKSADVPIVLGYLDYARKRGGFGPSLRASGDLRKDMGQIRDFYADKVGKYPDQFVEPRLKEEG